MPVSAVNDEQARYRNGDEAARWLTDEDGYGAMLASLHGPLAQRGRRLGYGPGRRGPLPPAGGNRLVAVVDAAGLAGVGIECVTGPLRLGPAGAGTGESVRQAGIGQALLTGADPAAVRRVTDAFAAVPGPYLTTGCVWPGSKAQLVRARRPASRRGPQP